MKWDNTDLRVGLMVVGALALGLLTFIWVGRLGMRNVGPLYTDVTDVQGIGPESPVFLGGFNVGRVNDVTPHTDSATGQLRFRVRMNIMWRLDNDAPLPLTEGVRARVVPPALDIGRGSIVLEVPKISGTVRLEPGAVIPSVLTGGTTNRMQLVVDSVGRDLRLVIAQVGELVNALEVTVASASFTMKTANATFASVNTEMPMIMSGVRSNLASADSLIKGLHTLTPVTVATLDSVRALLGDSRVAIGRATKFLDENEPQLASTIANLDMASAVLSNMLKEVSRRPLKALTGVKPPELGNGEARQSGATAKAPTP